MDNQQPQKMICYLKTPKLGFFPYLKEFVPIYHTWMQDQEILYLTGSEPLTLEEELENQASWLNDRCKYTFIIFERWEGELQENNFPSYTTGFKMAGDINLFFHAYIEENEAEIDVMIGEKTSRQKGLAKAAVETMMDFGNAFFQKTRFIAKIKKDNVASISLFKKLNYTQFADIEDFQEVHLEHLYSTNLTKESFLQKYPDFHSLNPNESNQATQN